MRLDETAAPPFQRIGIAGLGLVGGSIALRARRQWASVHVAGVDLAPVLRTALDRGLIDESRPAVADFGDRDLVVLAMPVPAIVTTLAACAGLPGVVTDVGSTKRRIMTAARDAGLRAFVGGHPMAGAAAGGLDRAEADLFQGRPWMLVSGSGPDHELARLRAFAEGLGARPVVIDADAHDRFVAHVSHAPQLLALALASSAGAAIGDPGLAVAGQGFADMTRLAASPFQMWQGILDTNADYIAEAVRGVAAHLPQTADELTDAAAMAAAFGQANAWHARARRAGGR